jgi:hypothetical protein
MFRQGPIGVIFAVGLAILGSIPSVLWADEPKGNRDPATTRSPDPSKPANPNLTRHLNKNETSISALLDSEPVRKEIGLSDQQASAIEALRKPQVDRSMPVLRRLRATRDPEERATIQAELGALQAEYHAQILKHLNRRQANRLMQIAIRNAGLRALMMPEVAGTLGLFPDQLEAIRAVIEQMELNEKDLRTDHNAKVARVRNEGRTDPGNHQVTEERVALEDRLERQLEANRKRAEREIGRFLTRGQKARFQKLIGPPVVEDGDDEPEGEPAPGERDLPGSSAPSGAP